MGLDKKDIALAALAHEQFAAPYDLRVFSIVLGVSDDDLAILSMVFSDFVDVFSPKPMALSRFIEVFSQRSMDKTHHSMD